ncbi:MAG: transcriptional regulator FtrA [Alphaproteobacteria bacterium]|nr:MAG: transcriptional regulator FtrA [Alphaproteobacteria bacterium]
MPHHVVLLAYDGLCTFEFGLAVEVFGLPRPELPEWYSFEVAALDPGPMRATGGIRVVADTGLEGLERADTVIIPGWRGIDAAVPEDLVAAVQAAHRRGARVMSLCSGIVVLGAAGVLDGRRATTHWRYTEAVRTRFPAIQLQPDVLYVDEGRVLTAAGSAAGLDLLLHVVRRDRGAQIATQIARRLVIAPHRDGGQVQFVDQPVVTHGPAVARAMDWARLHLDRADLTISDLAAQVPMSLRSFQRKFRAATGQSPADWLVRERVRRARDLLEAEVLPMETVAAQVGFGSADLLRHHFGRIVGLSPSVYRRRFGGAGQQG